jgi:hypothetical protein
VTAENGITPTVRTCEEIAHEGVFPTPAPSVTDRGQRLYETWRAQVRARGQSLLAGLLRCRRCGHTLHVSYGGRDSTSPEFSCLRRHHQTESARCISFRGTCVEDAVRAQILQAIEPMAIDAAIEAACRVETRQHEQREALRLEVEQGATMRGLPHAVMNAWIQTCDWSPRNWKRALANARRVWRDLVERASVRPGRIKTS